MKKISGLIDKANTLRFTMIDVFFLIIIFSLISIIITTFIFNKRNISKDTNSIENVYNEIVNYYYNDVNKDELTDSAIKGMMNYLDEKYSSYMDENKANLFNNKLDGTYKGIGIVALKNNDGIFVNNVMKNSPAEQAGLQVNDKILQIGSLTIKDKTGLDEVNNYIKNNNEIMMVVKRNDSELIFNISPGDIPNPVVSTKLLESDNKNYGYIFLESFSDASYNQFKSSLDELEKNGLKGLIIDLRGNKGGYIDKATSIAKIFLRKDKLVYSIVEKDKVEYEYDDTDETRDYPIIVLVNGQTASSSELLALALKESYGAILVGTKTYGKSKIQYTSSLKDKSMIKYTTGIWHSPNDNNIDEVGITPSITVENKKDIDSQLTKGLELLIELTK